MAPVLAGLCVLVGVGQRQWQKSLELSKVVFRMINVSLVQRCMLQAEFEQLQGEPHLAELLRECVEALGEVKSDG